MTTPFLIIAALLTLGTLLWVLSPLLKQKRLPVVIVIVLLAITTGLLYRGIGTPAALQPQAALPPQTLKDAITQLEAELQRDPNQIDGLRLLGRAYREEGNAEQSRARYAQAVKLAPDDADLLVEAAESRAMTDPARTFDAEAMALLRSALRAQPMHQRGRWFLGIAQRQAGDHAGAVVTWEPLLAVVDAKTGAALRPQIDAARKDAGLPPLKDTPAPAAVNTGLAIKIAVDPALARRMADATVFVIARRPGGPPMPVAVEKHPIAALPETITLDDGDSPMPTQPLSSLQEVEVIARVSASGNAMRQEGDVESKPVRVSLPAKAPVALTLP